MKRLRRRRLDWTTLGGIPIGLGLVLLGQAIEGGTLRSVFQLTAALIVFGGTLGAVLVSFSLDEVRFAGRRLKAVFVDDEPSPRRLIPAIVELALRARRQGIMAIDRDLDRLDEPFLKKGLRLAIDGNTPQAVRQLLEVEDRSMTDRESTAAMVYEAAGGYSPTFGILGAVLGLIQVMEHLSDPSRLGEGIAIAFVATVYGVGAANLVFLPIAAKLRTRARRASHQRELMIEAITAIQEGLSPQFIQSKLEGFVDGETAAVTRRPRRRAA